MELAPQLDPSGVSSVMAAKVVRSLLLLLGTQLLLTRIEARLSLIGCCAHANEPNNKGVFVTLLRMPYLVEPGLSAQELYGCQHGAARPLQR